jgi:Ca2+-transporting ATPase
MDMTDADLKVTAEKENLFARMFPEAKLKLILALQKSKHVVGMTGDGVNDALALKAADIGIAMGKQGTETAKQAADLVLLKDDFHAIVEAVGMGRRIYVNLKKAFQYIIAIHIPIILTVLLPLVFGWKFSTILLPVHVIFLELIMGPTCSIAFENEPMENDLMTQKPRKVSMALFSLAELGKSLVQGIVISFGVLGLIYFGIVQNLPENDIRGMAFLTLITANIILTFSSRSVDQSIIASFKKPNVLVMIIIPITIVLSILLFSIPALRQLFMISLPDLTMGLLSVLVGFLTIIWYEIVKWRNRQVRQA